MCVRVHVCTHIAAEQITHHVRVPWRWDLAVVQIHPVHALEELVAHEVILPANKQTSGNVS